MATATNSHPPRESALPESYAICVGDDELHVWRFAVTASAQEGEWQYVESLDHDNDPFLSLEYVELTAATDDKYWVYSRSYECELDCE